MKRFVVLLVLVLVAGLSLFAVWAGVRARATYTVAVHASGGHPDVRVIESEIDPGWVQSTATTTFEVHGQVGAAFRLLAESLGAEAVRPRLGFRLRHELLHGPASLWSWIATGFPGVPSILQVHTWIELDQESAREASQVIGELPAMVATSWVRLGGETETHLYLPAGTAAPKSELRQVTWHPVDGSVLPHERRILSQGRMPSLAGAGPTLEFRARGIEWEADSRVRSSAPARIAIRVRSLELRHRIEDAPWIVVHDLEIGQGEAASYGSHANQAYARFVRADVGGTVYGPGRVELVAEGSGGLGGSETAEPDRAVQRVQRALRLLPGFVVRASRAELTRVLLNGPAGATRGGGELRSDDQGGLRSARLDLEVPVALLSDLRRAWNPAAGDEPAPWFADWEDKGLLVRADERYQLRARVEDGALTLNQVPAEEVFVFAEDDEEEDAVAGTTGADEPDAAAEDGAGEQVAADAAAAPVEDAAGVAEAPAAPAEARAEVADTASATAEAPAEEKAASVADVTEGEGARVAEGGAVDDAAAADPSETPAPLPAAPDRGVSP